MSKKLISILCVIGMSISLYLTYAKLTATPLICKFGNCDIVQNSEYSALFGIPVAVYGVGFYFILLFMNINFESHKTIRKIFPFWILWGILFSTYLTYLELFIIKAICMWCVISFANIIIIYVVYLLGPRRVPPKIPNS